MKLTPEQIDAMPVSEAEKWRLRGLYGYTGAGWTERAVQPVESATGPVAQPSNIDAKAPYTKQLKEAKLEAFGHVKGGSWNHPQGTSKQNKLKGTTLDGGGAYDQGETNVPGTVHNKTLPTEEYSTAPALAGKGAPSRTYHTSTLGDGVGKPGISNKQSAAKAAPPNLPVVLQGNAAPGLAHVGSPSKAPAGTFAPGAPLYAPSPTGAPASIGLLPNVPVTQPTQPTASSGMTNVPAGKASTYATQALDMGDGAAQGIEDGMGAVYDAGTALPDWFLARYGKGKK